MATNLLNLPQLAGLSIVISSNSDWLDQLFVPQPGFPAAAVSDTGNLSSTSTTVINLSSIGGVVQNSVAVGYGIPAGTVVNSVGTTSVVLSNLPTVNLTGAEILFYPPALDLTGIIFTSELRLANTASVALLSMSTTNGLMVNGGTAGTFGWSTPAASLPNWPLSLSQSGSLACVVDIQASDITGAKVNLCTEAPIPVTVNLSVTR